MTEPTKLTPRETDVLREIAENGKIGCAEVAMSVYSPNSPENIIKAKDVIKVIVNRIRKKLDRFEIEIKTINDSNNTYFYKISKFDVSKIETLMRNRAIIMVCASTSPFKKTWQ